MFTTADLEKGGYRIDVICKGVKHKSLLIFFEFVLQLDGQLCQLVEFRELSPPTSCTLARRPETYTVNRKEVVRGAFDELTLYMPSASKPLLSISSMQVLKGFGTSFSLPRAVA